MDELVGREHHHSVFVLEDHRPENSQLVLRQKHHTSHDIHNTKPHTYKYMYIQLGIYLVVA